MGSVQGQADNANFDISNAVQCQQYKLTNNNGNANGNNQVNYMGPYCADQGGAIFLGLFTDDTSTEFADSYNGRETFQTDAGYNLPYGQTNVVEYDCISYNDADNGNGNGQTGVIKMCQTLYLESGKCESQISSTYVLSPNENACSYMSGVTIVRKDVLFVSPTDNHANHVARIFIFVFMGVFVVLAAFVWFLKSKLDRASIILWWIDGSDG